MKRQFRMLSVRTIQMREALAYADLKVVCPELPDLMERARWLVIWKLYMGFKSEGHRRSYCAETDAAGEYVTFYADPISPTKEEEDELVAAELEVLDALV